MAEKTLYEKYVDLKSYVITSMATQFSVTTAKIAEVYDSAESSDESSFYVSFTPVTLDKIPMDAQIFPAKYEMECGKLLGTTNEGARAKLSAEWSSKLLPWFCKLLRTGSGIYDLVHNIDPDPRPVLTRTKVGYKAVVQMTYKEEA